MMTLHQEACAKIMSLPSSAVPQVIAFIESLTEENRADEHVSERDRIKQAYLNMLEMKKQQRFPRDFDYKKILEEELWKKYGHSD